MNRKDIYAVSLLLSLLFFVVNGFFLLEIARVIQMLLFLSATIQLILIIKQEERVPINQFGMYIGYILISLLYFYGMMVVIIT